MKFLFSLTFLFLSVITMAQTPGGVATSPRIWLKANLGVLTTVSSMDVASWADQSPYGFNALPAGSPPIYSIQPSEMINYHPVINFVSADNDNLLISTNLNIAKTTNQNYSLFGVSRYQQGQLVYIGSQIAGSAPPQNAFQFGVRNSTAADVAVWRYNSVGCHHLTGQSGFYPTTGDQTVAIASAIRSGNSTSDYVNGQIGNTQNCASSFPTSNLRIGAGGGGGSGNVYSDQNMAEIIAFDVSLGAADQKKVNSYLAIKYGLTLDHSGGGTSGDYVASDNSVLWDASVSPAYHNDVLGIGRDDAECLLQKQSHSADDSTRLYIPLLGTSNATNTGNIVNDGRYILMGHNGGKMCATPASNAEIPPSTPASCQIFSRLEREWKITNTGFLQGYNCDFKLDPCASLSSVTPADLALLVDDDGDFSNGGTTCFYNGNTAGLFYIYSNSTLTVASLGLSHIGFNQTRYFTLASINSRTPLPIGLVYFEANLVDHQLVELDWQTDSEFDHNSFHISKSRNLTDWELVSKVDVAGSNPNGHSYSIQDANPYPGLSYYQLTSYDSDGQVSTEVVRHVKMEQIKLSIWPNPSSSRVQISGDQEQLKDISLYNSAGKRLPLNYLSVEPGSVTIDVSRLAAGLYLVKCMGGVYRVLKE